MEATDHMKDVLKCFISTNGEECVMMDSITLQHELFVTCSDSGKTQCRLLLAN